MAENKDFSVCRRCGRKLRSKDSRALGYGPTCYKQIKLLGSRRALFEMKKEDNSMIDPVDVNRKLFELEKRLTEAVHRINYLEAKSSALEAEIKKLKYMIN